MAIKLKNSRIGTAPLPGTYGEAISLLRSERKAIQENFDFIERMLNRTAGRDTRNPIIPPAALGPGGAPTLVASGMIVFGELEWEKEVTVPGATALWRYAITLQIESGGFATEAYVAWQGTSTFLARIDLPAFPDVFPPDQELRGDDTGTYHKSTAAGGIFEDQLVRYFIWDIPPLTTLIPPRLIFPLSNANYNLGDAIWAGIQFPEADIVDFRNCRIKPNSRLLHHCQFSISWNDDYQKFDGTFHLAKDTNIGQIFTHVVQPWGKYAVRVLSNVPGMIIPGVNTIDFGQTQGFSSAQSFVIYPTFRYTDLLVWEHVPGAAAYDLTYNIAAGGEVLVEDIQGTTYDLSAAILARGVEGPTVRWKVRAKDAVGSLTPTAWSLERVSRTLWTDPNTSAINNPTTAPGSLSCSQSTDADWGEKLTFNWSATQAACRSEIEIWNSTESLLLYRGFLADEDGPFYYYIEPNISYGIRPIGHSEIGTVEIHWRVRLHNWHALGNWTAFQTFTIT